MNAIYCRVSTADQAEHGYSVSDQLNTCREFAIKKEFQDIKEYIDDGYSGEFLERPALEQLRKDLHMGIIENVIILDPDRFSRKLAHQLLLVEEVEKAKAQLHFITHDYKKTSEGHLFFVMRTAFAEYEKTKIRERTIRGKKEKARQGKIVINQRPYGFDWDKNTSTYIINNPEANVIRLIYDLCTKERIGTVLICKELANRGYRNRNGTFFNVMFIYRVLTKELYCGTAYAFTKRTIRLGPGKVKYETRPKSEWVPISIPAIVSREVWNQAQEVIRTNSDTSRRNTKREYMLRSIIRCGVCGMGMSGRPAGFDAQGNEKLYYTCISKTSHQYMFETDKCASKGIPVRQLETEVWNAICSIASGKTQLTDYIVEPPLNDTEDTAERLISLKQSYEDLISQRSVIVKWFRNKKINEDEADRELDQIDKEIIKMQSAISNLEGTTHIKAIPTLSYAEVMNASTLEQKRCYLLSLGLDVIATRTSKEYSFKFAF